MFKKLFSISSLNVVAAILNFASTYVTVKLLGLQIFGEFNIFSAKIALISIVYLIIPSNFSIFQYQDDEDYKNLLGAYFLITSVLYIMLLGFFYTIGYLKISFIAAIIYAVPIACTNFFDIKYQATNQLNKYFLMLTFVAFVKLIAVIPLKFFPSWQTADGLLLALGIGQLLVLSFYLFDEKDLFTNSVTYSKKVVPFVTENFKLFKSYYFNSIIKRIKENSLILLFTYIVPSTIIGLFSLFLRILIFVLGLTRTIEAFFMNRKNLENYMETYRKYYWRITILMQVLFISSGIIYLKIILNQTYYIQIIFLSFLVYPYMKFLVERIKLLGNYDNKELIRSMSFYIGFILIASLFSYILKIKSINVILLSYFISELSGYTYLIFHSWFRGIKASKLRNEYV